MGVAVRSSIGLNMNTMIVDDLLSGWIFMIFVPFWPPSTKLITFLDVGIVLGKKYTPITIIFGKQGINCSGGV